MIPHQFNPFTIGTYHDNGHDPVEVINLVEAVRRDGYLSADTLPDVVDDWPTRYAISKDKRVHVVHSVRRKPMAVPPELMRQAWSVK